MVVTYNLTVFFVVFFPPGNLVGSRFEYDSLELESDSEISVDVKTSNPNGIIFYQSTGTDVMAIYLKEGKVRKK